MKKILDKDMKKIKAGSASGAFLNGIGNIINSIGNAFSSIITSITGSVYMFTDRKQNHSKAEYKIGDSKFSFDDSKELDLEKEKIKHQHEEGTDHTSVIDLAKGMSTNSVEHNYDSASYSSDNTEEYMDHSFYDIT